jgi:glutathione synthase/RimK-type ligase-like ATP-grasp enzyme
MKKIGILFGVENSFPSALVERINALCSAPDVRARTLRLRSGQALAQQPAGGQRYDSHGADEVRAEFVLTGAVNLDRAPDYAVIIDRISHDVPFYRAWLKQAALAGTAVINNPFRASADDKFLNYAVARRLGVAVPPTVLLPHKELPNQTSDKSMRNLEFPLDWESVFAVVGEHGFLKPIHGGGWRDVHEVRGREEFFRAYDRSRDLCMAVQKAVEYTEYFRCYVVGQKAVRIMHYDPRKPHAERYAQILARATTFQARKLFKRMHDDAVKLCRALGYDLNSVEFAVENGIPYAIDFLNPVPDADVHSVGAAHFDWIVEQVAELAIARAKGARRAGELRWAALLGAEAGEAKRSLKMKAKGLH